MPRILKGDRMSFRPVLAICGLCLLLAALSGCQTVKQAAEGAAKGFSEDWQSAKDADKQIRENLW